MYIHVVVFDLLMGSGVGSRALDLMTSVPGSDDHDMIMKNKNNRRW